MTPKCGTAVPTHLTNAHRFRSAASFRLNAHRIVADHQTTQPHSHHQRELEPAQWCASFYCHLCAIEILGTAHAPINSTYTYTRLAASLRLFCAAPNKNDEVINLYARELRGINIISWCVGEVVIFFVCFVLMLYVVNASVSPVAVEFVRKTCCMLEHLC